jgi:ATP-dependent helicase/DNAse subunit B
LTSTALERFRTTPGAYLITPTATMAEHLRHELARSGFAVRPSRVGTLAAFLEGWQLPAEAPVALLHLLVEEALERQKPVRFAELREFRGLHAALAALIEELPAGNVLSGDLGALAREVQRELAARGFAPRNARLLAAAERVRAGDGSLPSAVIFQGFFKFSAAEKALVDALAERTEVLEAPPDTTRLAAPQELFAAPTPEREAEEIARHILKLAAQGRRFREIGIVLRSRDPLGPLIETTLARFGIPVRGYFSDPAAAHPAVAYLSGVIRTLLAGWDHEELGTLLRMPVSGVGATPAGDSFDFDLRKKLPGRGLPVEAIKDPPAVLRAFEAITPWRREKLRPAEWAARFQTLRRLIPAPVVRDHAERDEVSMWRSTAAALAAFDAAAQQAAEILRGDAVTLEQFWKPLETALALEPLRVPDVRRDVVHVMDVFEARQWELPIVFVCGLLERVFPQYHGEDPLLGDPARRRLGMETSAEQQAEERLLFDLALTRATERTVLSYSRFNEKGDATLRSLFLGDQAAAPCEGSVRPAVSRVVVAPRLGPIEEAALQKALTERHRKLSATGIESFLQCPFQFFAGKTLRLKERPPSPRDRLDLLLQGSIVHRALAEWIRAPLLGTEVFEQIFKEECAKVRVPQTYRMEAVRLEMLRHFEGFIADEQVQLGWRTEAEKDFEFPLLPGVKVRGRIDRLELGPRNEALVIDYKYSAGAKVKEKVDESEAGTQVQGGVYMLAAKRLGFEPVGMLYCGLKKGVHWHGWHVNLAALTDIGEARTRDGLHELIDNAERTMKEAYTSIVAGRVEAKPADTAKCSWCDFRDACRVEGIGAELEEGAGQ